MWYIVAYYPLTLLSPHPCSEQWVRRLRCRPAAEVAYAAGGLAVQVRVTVLTWNLAVVGITVALALA